MRYLNSLSSKIARRKRREHGLSLVELLVAMIIFAVIAAATVSIIIVLNNSAAKFQNTTATQNELNIAMNTIQRDISQANSVTVGAKYDLALTSIQKDVTYKTYIFYYDGTSDNVPDGASTANLPQSTKTRGTIIEQVFAGTALQTQNILVGGYQPSNTWNSFFQYFTQNGSQLGSSGATLSGDQLAQVARIQFSLQSKVSDRTTPVELSSAAALNSYDTGITCNNCNPPIPAAPSLHGNLTYDSVTNDAGVHANLSWNQPGGTDSYTIYRTHGTQTTVVTTILQPETTSYVDSNGLVYGETYVYYIVANGASGLSAQSNTVSLTVRPPTGVIVNINTLPGVSTSTGLNQVKADNSAESGTTNPYGGLKYTVAKDLTNQITWQPANGAVGYYVYRNGSAAPIATLTGLNNTSYRDTDPAVTYGATNTYYVIAYNVGENGSGGNGVKSNNAALISPPTAPTITGTAYSSTTGTPYNTISVTSPGVAGPSGTTVTGNHLYYQTVNSGAAATPTCASPNRANGYDFATSGSVNPTVGGTGFGTASCYTARAYNDAGESLDSNPVLLEVSPGAFDFTNINTTASLSATNNGYYYTVARNLTNQLSWTPSAGASGYYIYRGNTRIGTNQGINNTVFQDTDSNYVTYGATNTYHIVAFSTWGNDELDTRSTNDATLISPPLAPSISGSQYGPSSGNPYNTLTLTGTVPNANGYYLYRNTSTSNVGDCSAASNTGQDFGTNQGNQLNDNVSFGSSTCYYAQSYNDAGYGQASNQVTLYVGPSDFSIVNQNPYGNLDGSTTVARGYTNEVYWSGSSGADSYTASRGGNNISTVGSGTNYIQDGGRAAGEVETYTVTATSSWSGTNYTRSVNSGNNAYLQSPPLPSTINANAVDYNSGNASSSQNTVQVTSFPGSSNTTKVHIYGVDSSAASTGCGNVGEVGNTTNISTGVTITDGVNWGTSSCYYAVNENAAGYGPNGSQDTSANQKPGSIVFNTLSNNTSYMDIYTTYSSTTNCSGPNGPIDYCYDNGSDASTQAESFGLSNHTSGGVTYREAMIPLQYTLNWGRDASNNNVYGVATSGTAYKVSYATNVCGNTTNTPSTVSISASSGVSSRNETNLTPGCVYTATVTAYANNGQSRPSSSAFATAPDVVNAADNYILVTTNANFARRLQTVDLTTNHGYHGGASSSINIYQKSQWDPGSGSDGGDTFSRTDALSTGDTANLWTAPANASGSTKIKSTSWTQTQESFTNYTTVNVNSLLLNFHGSVSQGNGTATTSSWGTQGSPNSATYLPETSYTDNYHPRYYSTN